MQSFLPSRLALAAALVIAAPAANAQTVTDEQAAAIAAAALDAAPVFDGHNDAPGQLRSRHDNQINAFDFADTMDEHDHVGGDDGAMHTDLVRLKKGKVGGQFWSVYVPHNANEAAAVQQTIEQIDVTKRLIARNPDSMRYALTADEVENAMREGKIASLLGMEGGYSIASNLGVLRQWDARRTGELARLRVVHLGNPDAATKAMDAWLAANPEPKAAIADVADHILHIRKVAGVEHIGIGGDYDGMPIGPVGMEDVSGYPALFAELAKRGLSQAELEMIASRNVLRVMRAAEAYAASVADQPPIETLINAPAKPE